ncbi:MAG: winged helix-turn-helix transcriptional regulator [Anaerolineales bacterium]|nr:winged helix-turn-helix transcriptional regulator [Anaerolineales bacterium]
MNKLISPHEKIGDLLASIGNPVRVQILLAIGTGEACVCHLESLLELRQAYISQQLMLLRQKKLITSRREGKYIYYRLVKPEVLEVLRVVGEIVGVPKGALVIQEHSSCECPRCSAEETVSSNG